MKKTALIIAAADGILSLQTGVGVIVNTFFEAFTEIYKLLGQQVFDLHAICPLVNSDSTDFSSYAHSIVMNKCKEYGGRLTTIKSFTSGNSLNEIWKGTAQYTPSEIWDQYCIELAEAAKIMSLQYKRVVLITHDTLFVNVSKYMQASNIHVCWIPHSLATLFAAPNQVERFQFEKKSIKNIIQRNDYIGFISTQTKEHLLTRYDFPERGILSFYSGIFFNSVRYKSKGLLESFFEKYSIPTNKELIFSWGRCSHQKGIDIIVQSYIKLLKKQPHLSDKYHLLLLCPTETTYSDYLNEIKNLLCQLPEKSFTFITEFQNKIQYEILAYKKLSIVLLCSRYESFGLTSIEAIFKAQNNTHIVYSPIPTFHEVLQSFPNTSSLGGITEIHLQNLLLYLINNSPEKAIQTEVLQKLEKKFSLVKNHSLGLINLLKITEKYEIEE